MTKSRKAGKADFTQLTDRIIAPPPPGPFLAIRTNLDEPSKDADDSKANTADITDQRT